MKNGWNELTTCKSFPVSRSEDMSIPQLDPLIREKVGYD
jgi:hypothetical protein